MQLIRKTRKEKNKNGFWIYYAIFKCPDCLQEVERTFSNGKISKSCGNHQHGETDTKLYSVWTNIKQRCLNLNSEDYPDYGGREIIICPEWINDYTKFRDWALNNGYKEGLQINRINNDGNYEPNNCNFVTAKENSRNRRGQKIKNIEMADEIRVLYATGNYIQQELAEKYGVKRNRISIIVNNKNWGV